MNITRKQSMLEQLNLQIQHLKDLQAKTATKTWAADEATFEQCLESATEVIKKIYKGNATKKVDALNDAIDNQGGVVYIVRADGSHDPRNHDTIFKPKVTAAIKTLQSYRLEIETHRLWHLRKTKVRQLTAIGAGIITLLGIVKVVLEIINLVHKSSR
jgi:hypothetical protein